VRWRGWLAAAALSAATAAQAAPPDCRTSPVYPAGCFGGGHGCREISRAEQPCFSVRGRIVAANGDPTFRVQPQGTDRLLGVVGGDADAASPTVLPQNLRAAMTPPDPGQLRSVVGVFRVCPLAPDRAGWTRPVCIVDFALDATADDRR
jgi:hypothetical protein